jgi:hypothetical protein
MNNKSKNIYSIHVSAQESHGCHGGENSTSPSVDVLLNQIDALTRNFKHLEERYYDIVDNCISSTDLLTLYSLSEPIYQKQHVEPNIWVDITQEEYIKKSKDPTEVVRMSYKSYPTINKENNLTKEPASKLEAYVLILMGMKWFTENANWDLISKQLPMFKPHKSGTISKDINDNTFYYNKCVGTFDISDDEAAEYCKNQTTLTGHPHQWYYSNQRIHVYARIPIVHDTPDRVVLINEIENMIALFCKGDRNQNL